jgi:S1-C subfamily serine protease
VIGTCGEEAAEFGSGAVLDAKGHVLTSWHVVSYASEAVVVLKPPSGVEIREDLIFAAEVVKVDEVTDLALLKMKSPPKGLKMLKAGSADELEVGQDVHAIGHPEGEVWTYTKGIISQIRPDYEWTYLDGSYHKAKVIQTQTPINPGSSGSPLLNQRAELIGINSFGMRGEGLNYAVAIDVIQDFLRKKGSRISKKEPSWGDLSAQHYRELDRDKDGVVDLVLVDMDGDKKPDIWIFDDDQDTRTDYLGFDSDRNQKVDVIARDLNKDGIPETYEFDPDEDGVPDLYGIDIDGDGEIDRYYRG